MGETVEFPGNGGSAGGYLAVPAGGSGPGVIVLQEWWGLVPQIRGVCDRLAAEGFTALAPDLYRGEVARHDEPDRAGALMAALPAERASRDMEAAVDFLLAHPAATGGAVGVVGFCMGGMLTMRLAVQAGPKVGAAVAYYGAPLGDDSIAWERLAAPILGHFADVDDFFPLAGVEALAAHVRALGKDITLHVYEGAGHAFANEEDTLGTHDAEYAAAAWARTVDFLRAHLG